MTHYPGLRRSLCRSPTISETIDSPDAIYDLWRGDREDCDLESVFSLKFAACCLANNEAATYLEGIRPSELGYPCDPAVVTRLSIHYCE
jgi:hypothetical protein